MIPQGVLYVAYGQPALTRLKASLASLHRFAPRLPASVVSDKEVFGATTIIRPDADPGARTYKTQMYSLSPFEQTLFLDVDTELRSSPEAGFKILNYVDLVLGQDLSRVLAQNRWRHLNAEEVRVTAEELGTDHHMYFNSGVIFFKRNARMVSMMAAWNGEWQRWGGHDQMALLRAMHKHPVRIAPMRAPWNTRNAQEVAFIHHRHHAARREGAPR